MQPKMAYTQLFIMWYVFMFRFAEMASKEKAFPFFHTGYEVLTVHNHRFIHSFHITYPLSTLIYENP